MSSIKPWDVPIFAVSHVKCFFRLRYPHACTPARPVSLVMSLRELTNECILDLARVWRLAWHGLSLYKRGRKTQDFGGERIYDGHGGASLALPMCAASNLSGMLHSPRHCAAKAAYRPSFIESSAASSEMCPVVQKDTELHGFLPCTDECSVQRATLHCSGDTVPCTGVPLP